MCHSCLQHGPSVFMCGPSVCLHHNVQCFVIFTVGGRVGSQQSRAVCSVDGFGKGPAVGVCTMVGGQG